MKDKKDMKLFNNNHKLSKSWLTYIIPHFMMTYIMKICKKWLNNQIYKSDKASNRKMSKNSTFQSIHNPQITIA